MTSLSPAHSAIFRLIGSRSELNEVDVAIELPEYASEAIELAEKYGGGQVERYVEQLVDSRNRRLAERDFLMESMDLLKQGKPTEEIAGQFNMQRQRPCHRAIPGAKRERRQRKHTPSFSR